MKDDVEKLTQTVTDVKEQLKQANLEAHKQQDVIDQLKTEHSQALEAKD